MPRSCENDSWRALGMPESSTLQREATCQFNVHNGTYDDVINRTATSETVPVVAAHP